MKIRKRYKNNSKVNILLPLIFLFVVFLSVGYSSLNQELNITSEAVFRVEESIRITDIKLVGSAFNGIENYNSSYSKDRIKTGITLNEANSSITYQVTITNTGNVPMNLSFLDNINYSNDDITYELNEKLPYMINKGEEKKIELTYKWSSYNEESKNLDSVIKFNFVKAESVLASGEYNYMRFANNSSFDRSKVESIKFMPTIDVPSSAIEVWDASLNKDGSVMAYTLDNDSNDLYELYIAGYGEIKLSEANSLFFFFTNVETLDFNNIIDTSNVTDMLRMFQNCYKLTSVDLSTFDTSKVTNMADMFNGCSSLLNLNLSSFDTSSVTNMINIFASCSKMLTVDVSNFNTSKVTNMASMFSECSSLEGIINLSHFDISNVSDMNKIFYNCSKLQTIILNNWNGSKLTNISWMFRGCSSINKIEMNNFNAPLLTSVTRIFWSYYNSIGLVEKIQINNWNIPNVSDLSYMFWGCSKLMDLEMEGFNAPSAANTLNMFYGCSSLEGTLDLSNFDTSKVINMSSMFYGCSKLVSIDVSNFNTSKVTDMSYMFYGCSSLGGTLNLSHFDVSNVSNMSGMFNGCSKLAKLILNNWNAEKLTNISALFSRCTSVTELEMNNFNAPLLTSTAYMFNPVKQVQSISLSNWNIPNVTDLTCMFWGCSRLVTLNMNGFSVPSATTMVSMFQGDSQLIKLNLSGFSMQNVTNVSNAFLECSITELDISGIDSATYEKDIFKSMINQVGDITFYVKDSECKTLLEAIKPNATVEIKSA